MADQLLFSSINDKNIFTDLQLQNDTLFLSTEASTPGRWDSEKDISCSKSKKIMYSFLSWSFGDTTLPSLPVDFRIVNFLLIRQFSPSHHSSISACYLLHCGIRTYLFSHIIKGTESLMELGTELQNLSPVTNLQIADSCSSLMDLSCNVPMYLRRNGKSPILPQIASKKQTTCNFSVHPS